MLRDKAIEYSIFGKDYIEQGALDQMDIAMRLPITVSGSLMPDAHQGYGLPIGGVLATRNAVIPYAVGVDIGCRMQLSVYPLDKSFLETNRDNLKNILLDNTRFGWSAFDKPIEHAVLESDVFNDSEFLYGLKDKAAKQIGSSGGGNHFVDFGIIELDVLNETLSLDKGSYLAVLSHSGSRALGATIATHFTKLAIESCPLPEEAKNLAWLDLSSELGIAYWRAMTLAGNYASACHHQIHYRIAKALGEESLLNIENHHNFAWKDVDSNGNDIIVHRKGATPAQEGVLGLIPGSMISPCYIVKGKGNDKSLKSASHGAGRAMSRTLAKKNINKSDVEKLLIYNGVSVIGSDLDEAPMAYKDINKVMELQKDLVEVLCTFTPKIVRMCDSDNYFEVD